MSNAALVYVYKVQIIFALNRVFSLLLYCYSQGLQNISLFCFNLNRVAWKYIINKSYYHMTTLLNVKYLWLASKEQSNPLQRVKNMTSLLYAFSISISVYAITYISHIAKSSVCHIYTALCFLLPCLICYFSQMKEPTYIILVVYISRIFLSELFIRFLHFSDDRIIQNGFPFYSLDILSQGNLNHYSTYICFCCKNSKSGKMTSGLSLIIPSQKLLTGLMC